MAIHLHRSNRTESLVQRLCEVLRRVQPADPFLSTPIVVGSRGMERWLRHEIATTLDIASGLDFPFPRQALAGAAHWLLSSTDANAAFWTVPSEAREQAKRWERDALAFRLLPLIRAHADSPEFKVVSRYLSEGREKKDAVDAREMLFAAEVGDVLDRLMHERFEDSLSWATDPRCAPEPHRWLAQLLSDLDAHTDAHSPLVLHQRLTQLRQRGARSTGRSLCLFGLSTMGPGDRERLAAIADFIEVHLFVLVPTDRWIEQLRTPYEAGAARRQVDGDDQREALEEELALDNPILSSLAAPSRDLQSWLERVGYEDDRLVADDPLVVESPTHLHQLQSWILSAEPLPDEAAWEADPSVSAHSTYGALRQAEVLRDQLLALFAADPTLEPRDVLVMTPDIQTFAPLLSAVFSRTGGVESPLPRLPHAIADLGLRRTNVIAEVLLHLLQMASERLTASWVADFLSLEPVRLRWKLDDERVSRMRDLIRDSGFRWGADSADRALVQQPSLDQNTARFALERLSLGVLMPDESEDFVLNERPVGLGPAAPLSSGHVREVGTLNAILRAVLHYRAQLRAPASLQAWRERLRGALDAFTQTSESAAWLRTEVDQCVDEWVESGGPVGEQPIEQMAVFKWFEDRFEQSQSGERAITGAIQICALEPMRSVPFRVVALLGMDDAVFPRGGRRRTWDPMEQRRAGERDRRETDRHLMLEALLSARDHLLLLWSGRDVQKGEVQPAAVPVEELLETLGRLTGRSRDELVQTHPLQPWSALNFGAQPSSFDLGMARSARQLREILLGQREASGLGLSANPQERLPDESGAVESLAINALVDGLIGPQKLLLRDRLGLSVTYDDAPLLDREPLDLGTLEAWPIRKLLLDRMLAHAAMDPAALVERVTDRLAAEGRLPLMAGGVQVVNTLAKQAACVVESVHAIEAEPMEPLLLNHPVEGGPVLVGQIDGVWRRADRWLLQRHTPSKRPNDTLCLRTWVSLLVLVAAGHPVDGARLFGYGDTRWIVAPETPEAATQRLNDLLLVWREARHQALPLFKVSSPVMATALLKQDGGPLSERSRLFLRADLVKTWAGDDTSAGDLDCPWVRTLFVDYQPTEHLEADGPLSALGLADRVWSPLLRAERGSEDLKSDWKKEASR